MQTNTAKPNTMKGNLLFNFSDMSKNGKAQTVIEKQFAKAGTPTLVIAFDDKTKRAAGVSYKEALITFVDNQQIKLRIKNTGDVYQVLLNGQLLPLQNQDDHPKVFLEIAKALDAGRKRFEKLQEKTKAPVINKMRMSTKQIETAVVARHVELKGKIAEVEAAIVEVKKKLDE